MRRRRRAPAAPRARACTTAAAASARAASIRAISASFRAAASRQPLSSSDAPVPAADATRCNIRIVSAGIAASVASRARRPRAVACTRTAAYTTRCVCFCANR